MRGYWTPNRIELLRRYWADGFSASEVAMKLPRVDGIAPTRNAVIAKIHRANLHAAAGSKRYNKALKKKTKWNQPKPRPLAVKIPPAALKALEQEPLPNSEPPPDYKPLGKKITLLKRDERGRLHASDEFSDKICRFPIGDTRSDDFHFCGHEAVQGRPYCACHCRVAYATPVPNTKTVAKLPNRHEYGVKENA